MQLGMRTFKVACHATGLDKDVRALDERDALEQVEIDPRECEVESASGHRIIFKYHGETCTVVNIGY